MLLIPDRGNADTIYVSGIPSVQRASLERVLGKPLQYAIAPVAGLKSALRWNCGCRAIEHDDGAYTLIACGRHQKSVLKSASMISFR